MFPRGDVGASFAAGPVLLVVASVLGVPDFFDTLGCLGVETRFFDFVFFADFLSGFLGGFFATGFFTSFLAAFFAFLTTRLPFLARFFDAVAVLVWARLGLRTFLAFLPEVFFLGGATRIPLWLKPV